MNAPPFASAFRRQSWKVNRLAVPRPRPSSSVTVSQIVVSACVNPLRISSFPFILGITSVFGFNFLLQMVF